MRINYAILLASVTGVMSQMYNQGIPDQCGCLQTRSCVVNSPCLQKEKVRKVKKQRTRRGSKCGACNGQGPCNACQQSVEKQYEAVPVFTGEPIVYRVVRTKQLQPGSRGYGAIPQGAQYAQPQLGQYSYQQPQAQQYQGQQYQDQYISQQYVQAPMPQQYAQAPLPQQYVQAPLPQQYGQAPCNNCNNAPVQKQRVYVPLKPGFWQKRTMKKAVRTSAARQPCAGPSCTGCATCGGNNNAGAYSVPPVQYYAASQPSSYQVQDSLPLVQSVQPPMVANVEAPLVQAAPTTVTSVADSSTATLNNTVTDLVNNAVSGITA